MKLDFQMYKFPAGLKYKGHLNLDVGVDKRKMKQKRIK